MLKKPIGNSPLAWASMRRPARGSNNWTVGPALSASGHTMVANDPHLSLGNPPTFHLVHLVARGGDFPIEVMGASIPGVPGVVLGMNRHIAWAATDSYVDSCDVYSENLVDCNGGKCAVHRALNSCRSRRATRRSRSAASARSRAR